MVRYRLKYFAPAVLYVILIFTLSSLNQRIVSNLSWGLEDFLLHFTEYHFYGVTLIWAVMRDKPRSELKSSYRLAVSIGALSGMADEFYQSFVPSRYSTIEDVVADVFGVILSIITFSLLMKIPILERFRKHA
ncbi:MAG: VanZ family protein [Candidatus Marinimicrobia bacterium]|jgi:VanZ family protein|nr:VanZ family protein [Candidatus Neomarinimicrobiota bacterium]MBT3574574.1 VanZ family protein [Candidatus Neomarinimicrobiota bacterium]MBT3680458.1 VanZ family protein [Candidatus Neomarinimicrobiota bacterium]MBT3951194.1 VanZ family protein [Candidatus Neomarinimicrobiota bacterium]MBT4253037.1 VanZ family protein [Candidatus Neomarinimicrobiota bacterium]